MAQRLVHPLQFAQGVLFPTGGVGGFAESVKHAHNRIVPKIETGSPSPTQHWFSGVENFNPTNRACVR
jgi:hypothetical protein